jgi:hypothetical protein
MESWNIHRNQRLKENRTFWFSFVQLIDKITICADTEVIFWHYDKIPKSNNLWLGQSFYFGDRYP